jgi:uncharacterized integral membrane protein
MTFQPGIEPTGQPAIPQTVPSGPPAAQTPAGQAPAGNQAHAARSEPPTAGLTSRGRVRTTRTSAVWVVLIVAALLLIALLIFIAQNSTKVSVHYLGLSGHISLAIALLLAAVGGVLLVAIPGTARIIQLRRALKKNAVTHAKR